MRWVKLLCVPAFVAGLIVGPAGTSLADGPYTVNMRLHAHKAIEFDPNWLFEAEPCFVATGDLTEVFNAEAHALAAGIDDQGNFVAPLHVQETVEESVLFDPYDPALPTYSGHSTVHVTNLEDSPTPASRTRWSCRGRTARTCCSIRTCTSWSSRAGSCCPSTTRTRAAAERRVDG